MLIHDETGRLNALLKYDILDSLEEKEYQEIVEIASEICQAPLVYISFIDNHRQWFKASINLPVKETLRSESICQYTILQNDLVEILNPSEDPRLAKIQAIKEMGIGFYAGVPISTPEGYNIGTLCVLDLQKKALSQTQRKTLKILANQVMKLLELRLKNKELEQKNQSLLYHKEYQSKVLGLISHDLRSPLSQIIGFSELVIATIDLNKESKEIIKNVRSNTQNALLILDNILNWAKLQINGFAILKKEFSAKELISEILKEFEWKIKQKEVDFTCQLPTQDKLNTDKFIFSSIVRNLLSNALKFTPNQGSVCLSISKNPEKDSICIVVQDTGIGIPPNLLEKILQNQPVTSRKGVLGEKGAGAGLQVLREFITMLDGQFFVESQENVGTTFRVSLPT
ncbi:MAG: GAF domain-containing sensor histidine kinase [Raineya sp.]